jgi:dephospho-CoA kinase
MPKRVFGLVGPIASGKGTVAKILVEKGYSAYSLSDRIREEINKRGIQISRETLNTVSNEMRQLLGSDILAKKTAEIIEKDNPQLVVIDSIRNPAEAYYLKKKLGAKIIGVMADQKRRFDLFQYRGTNTAGVFTWEDFKKLDDAELAQVGDFKQQVQETLKLADVIIENNGTIEELRQKVEKITSEL